MNRTTIDWKNPREGWELTHRWNPVIGCKHGCSYCYAERMNHRFKWIPIWTEPRFFMKRLLNPYKIKKPGIVFVGSICDLFGDWIDRRWIREVINICKISPWHKFMFLTKNPKRYFEFEFPDNCWLGCTVTQIDGLEDLELIHYMNKLSDYNKTFLSAEPILGAFKGKVQIKTDLVIVGAMTGIRPVIPKSDWIQSIIHDNIYYKENIRKYL